MARKRSDDNCGDDHNDDNDDLFLFLVETCREYGLKLARLI